VPKPITLCIIAQLHKLHFINTYVIKLVAPCVC
jgi:hypothetical protein